MKKSMKRVVCAFLLVGLIFSISACTTGNNTSSTSDVSETAKVQESTDTKSQDQPDGGDSNFNETGLPIVKNPITLRIMVPHPVLAKKNFEEKDWYKKVAQDTNVNIEWEEISNSNFAEKVNLAMNSGDLPDALYNGSITDLAAAIDAGYVLALDELIEKYAPNQKKLNELYPITKTATTYLIDGKRYVYAGLGYKPEAALRAPLFMNKVWLDKLGLKEPTTTDELYAVLKAFKTQDPNGNGTADEIPITFNTGLDVINDLFGAWGIMDVKNWFHCSIKDGKLVFNPTLPAYKEALTYFHKLYSEGLLDPEFLTQDGSQKKAKGSQQPAILGAFTGFDDGAAGPNADQYTVILPLKGPYGDQMWPYNPSELEVYKGLILFKDCEHPEAAIRWVDYLNDGVNAIINAYGPENLAWKRDESTKTWHTLDKELAEKGLALEDIRQSEATQNGPEMSKVTEITGYQFVPVEGSRDSKKLKWTEMYRPYFNKEFFPVALPIMPSTDEKKEISLLQTDFDNYFSGFVAESIMEGLDDQKWEEFLKKCEDMQVDRIVAFYQKQLDDYKQLEKK